MKTLISFIILAAMASMLVYFAIDFSSGLENILTKANNEMKVNLGQQVILNKDTLIIIDYSLWNDTYTLENGIIISREFLKLTPKK